MCLLGYTAVGKSPFIINEYKIVSSDCLHTAHYKLISPSVSSDNNGPYTVACMKQ